MKNDNINIIPSINKEENKVTIVLSNELTIYTIENIKDEFDKFIDKFNQIEIVSDNIKNMDLSFVQLIKSIQKTALKKGKFLTINIELKEETKNLFENTSINRIIKS